MGFHFQCGRHKSMPAVSDAPTACARYLGQQAMDAKHCQSPVEFGTQAAASVRIGRRLEAGDPQQITAGEAVQGMFTAQYGGKQRCFAFAQRVESSHPTRLTHNWFANDFDRPDVRREVLDDRETLQVTGVGLEGDFRVAGKIANVFGHLEPSDNAFALVKSGATDFKLIGAIDHRFDPQQDRLLVVHFDGITIDPMLDAYAFMPPLDIGAAVAVKATVALASQKPQNVSGAPAQGCVFHQLGVQPPQDVSILKQHIGGVFGLLHTPAVPHTPEQILKQRIDLKRQTLQKTAPVQTGEAGCQPIGSWPVSDSRECVLDLAEADAPLSHAAGQPLVSVEIDLDREREPGLQPNVDQPEDRIHKIKVQTQTFRLIADQMRTVLAELQLEALGLFHSRKHADQAFADSIPLGHGPGFRFFVQLAAHMTIGTTGLCRHGLRVLHHALGHLDHIAFKVLHQHLFPSQKRLHPLRPADRQITFENYSVETIQDPRYTFRVFVEKFFQGVLLILDSVEFGDSPILQDGRLLCIHKSTFGNQKSEIGLRAQPALIPYPSGTAKKNKLIVDYPYNSFIRRMILPSIYR